MSMKKVACPAPKNLSDGEALAHRAALPGKVISFYISPIDSAYKAELQGTSRSSNLVSCALTQSSSLVTQSYLQVLFDGWENLFII